jgi:hypothetical protein
MSESKEPSEIRQYVIALILGLIVTAFCLFVYLTMETDYAAYRRLIYAIYLCPVLLTWCIIKIVLLWRKQNGRS